MSPLEALKTGRGMLIEMVRNSVNPKEIEKGIVKMAMFEDEIRRSYRSKGEYPMDSINFKNKLEQYYREGEA